VKLKKRINKGCLLTIDPGLSGGIAWRDTEYEISACPMPEGLTEIVDKLRIIQKENPGIVAVIEKTGTYMPGNSGPGAVTFARHCGHIEAILCTLGISTIQVTPQKWMKCIGALPKEKKDRKNAIKEWVARRHPEIKVTLKTSDALALLECVEKELLKI
jgi:hypothetical protein